MIFITITFAVKEIALKCARKIELTCRKIINSNTSDCLTLKLNFVIEVTYGVSPTEMARECSLHCAAFITLSNLTT